MFEQEYFVASVDKICRRKLTHSLVATTYLTGYVVFMPRFKQTMESPNLSVAGLIAGCDKQRKSPPPPWPADGHRVIYLRVYTHTDREIAFGNDTGLYVGYSGFAQMRDESHTKITKWPRQPKPNMPTHYDIAKLCHPRRRHVLIAILQQDTETFAAGGTPEIRTMSEQTVMLMMKSYCPWTLLSDSTSLFTQRARLLQTIEKRARRDTNFQPGWAVCGTNVSSPLFEFRHQHDLSEVSMMQTLSVHPPHPSKPAMTVSRVLLRFRKEHKAASTHLRGHRVGDPESTTPLRIHLPHDLVSRIRQDVEVTPSTEAFYVVVVFELVEGGEHKDREHPYPEHENPYAGLPTVGPYKDFGAGNALGVRVEWRHHTLPKWFTAPIQISLKRQRHIASALRKGDATELVQLYQEVTAIIHMIRGEDLPNAPTGFWRSLGFRGSRPAIRKYEVDHLEQTARWVAPVTTHTTWRPTRSSFSQNSDWLCDYRDNISRLMSVGERPGKQDRLFYIDTTSARHAFQTAGPAGVRCDTCTIFAIRSLSQNVSSAVEPCQHNPSTGTCPPCRALNRRCTFTPITKLLIAWVGDENANHKDYVGDKKMHLPVYGGGPLRRLVPHLGMPDEVVVKEIPEPFGWTSLYAHLDAGELDEDEEAGGLAEDEAGEGEDDGE
jgi:hypothetical protein